MSIGNLAEENNIDEELAEILLFSFIENKNIRNELSDFISEKVKLIDEEINSEDHEKTDFKSFTHVINIRGRFNASFQFQCLEGVKYFIETQYRKYKREYRFISFSISNLDIFNLNDECNVSGEGTETFRILGIKKYSKNSYGYILDNGFVEPVHKCTRDFLK